jgi:hypothetical protein
MHQRVSAAAETVGESADCSGRARPGCILEVHQPLSPCSRRKRHAPPVEGSAAPRHAQVDEGRGDGREQLS